MIKNFGNETASQPEAKRLQYHKGNSSDFPCLKSPVSTIPVVNAQIFRSWLSDFSGNQVIKKIEVS